MSSWNFPVSGHRGADRHPLIGSEGGVCFLSLLPSDWPYRNIDWSVGLSKGTLNS